jgi:hypothetical protein
MGSSRRDDDAGVKPSDERTPLLATISPVPTNQTVEETIAAAEGVHNEDEDAPLPKLQIFFLCYTRLVEPIAFFSIFPYLNYMIETVGEIPVERVGFYSGLIESLFSLTQMCVMIHWGKVMFRPRACWTSADICRLRIDMAESRVWSFRCLEPRSPWLCSE